MDITCAAATLIRRGFEGLVSSSSYGLQEVKFGVLDSGGVLDSAPSGGPEPAWQYVIAVFA